MVTRCEQIHLYENQLKDPSISEAKKNEIKTKLAELKAGQTSKAICEGLKGKPDGSTPGLELQRSKKPSKRQSAVNADKPLLSPEDKAKLEKAWREAPQTPAKTKIMEPTIEGLYRRNFLEHLEEKEPPQKPLRPEDKAE